jgi:hypothetical protein
MHGKSQKLERDTTHQNTNPKAVFSKKMSCLKWDLSLRHSRKTKHTTQENIHVYTLQVNPQTELLRWDLNPQQSAYMYASMHVTVGVCRIIYILVYIRASGM